MVERSVEGSGAADGGTLGEQGGGAEGSQPEEPDWGSRVAAIAQRMIFSRIARELLIIIGGYFLYSVIRNAAPEQEALAVAHAYDIIEIEDVMGIGFELDVNRFFDQHTALAVFSNYFYAVAFSATTILTLIVLWRRDWNVFRFHRTVLVIMTAAAMFTYWIYPLAPPRLLPGSGYVDTFIKYNTWGRFYVSSGEEVSNQYAAMPSMHTGWAVWAGVALWCISARWWVRTLAALLPIVTVVVIVGTANHFVLDAVAGLAYYLCVLGAVLALTRWRRRKGHARVAYARVTHP
ncbi:MAG: phosphatase PAP2 family protein [Actinomycetaceae bacterium]|nr:phosphatase PAP2 family protein [Actinomycetaceae bacterium]